MEAQITLSPFLHCRQASDKHGEQGWGNYFITSCPFQLQTLGAWSSRQLMPQTLQICAFQKPTVAFPLPAGISNSKWAGELSGLWFVGGSWKVSNLNCSFKAKIQLKCVSVNQRSDQKRSAPFSFFFSWELITWLCCWYSNLSAMLNLEGVLAAVLVIFSCWHHQIWYLYRLSVFKPH